MTATTIDPAHVRTALWAAKARARRNLQFGKGGELRITRVESSRLPGVDAVLIVEADDESLHSLADMTGLADAITQTWRASWVTDPDKRRWPVVVSTSEATHTYTVDGDTVRVLVQLTTVTDWDPTDRHAHVHIEGGDEFETWTATDPEDAA